MNAVLESTTPAALEPPPKFVIPEMLKDIRPRINTSYPYIKRLHAQWLYENYGKPEPGSLHGAIERMDSLYDASVFPDGIPERVAHHASILTLIFQCDDLTTSDPEQCAKIIAEDPDAHDARVMEGLWQTIRQHAPSDAVYQRLRGRWTRWMHHLKVEKEFRDNWFNEDMESFLKVRLMSSGMQPYIAAMEYVLDIDVSDLIEDPDMKRAVDLVSWHCAFTNDVYSYAVEYYSTEDTLSSVLIMRNTRGLDAQQAISAVCEMMEEMYAELAGLIARLHERYAKHPLGARLHLYLDTYLLMVVGTLQWHIESPRYGGHGHIWNGLPMRQVDVSLAGSDKMEGAGAPQQAPVGSVYVS